ncbi:2-hydroxyacid dehydrogenase [Hydrogenophaga laconesensis]|uniref:D-3-phosphoglycerate dehydrogenase n=1 Tax=Hydrogenophaga laconesensis TaxID=1805971 RepID=A0ABU1VDM8_9BURK|nr:NAD(P)-dependent oxidoreductase [Hydrogenophaga laconesensis]MDR7095569.1 D-3-phosphoglycerate dehydrogenase [Hydrogenophaga laconesensis]
MSSKRNEPVLIWERVMPDDPSIPWLREQGFDVRLGKPNHDPAYRRHLEADFIADASGCEGVLISGGIRITPGVMDALPGLKVISKIGIGVDTVDVAAATARGIAVCNTPGGNDSVAVAEHALALLLALRKQLHVWTREYLQSGGWRNPQVFSGGLDGSTLGIAGFGRIGRALAQRVAGWNVRVLVHDPLARDLPPGVQAVDMDELLAQSDAVSLHCPALPGDRPLLDTAALARMKKGAVLINTARATLVDAAALIAALDAGTLAGAAFDVFDPEPPARDDPLLAHPRVLSTPHVASWTWEGFFGRRQQAAENLARVVRGEPGASIVNAPRPE